MLLTIYSNPSVHLLDRVTTLNVYTSSERAHAAATAKLASMFKHLLCGTILSGATALHYHNQCLTRVRGLDAQGSGTVHLVLCAAIESTGGESSFIHPLVNCWWRCKSR